jgi:hypothetical protein
MEFETLKTFGIGGTIAVIWLGFTKLLADTPKVATNRHVASLKPQPSHFGSDIKLASAFSVLQSYRNYSEDDYVAALNLADDICIFAAQLEQKVVEVDIKQDYVTISRYFFECNEHLKNILFKVKCAESQLYLEREQKTSDYRNALVEWQKRKHEFENIQKLKIASDIFDGSAAALSQNQIELFNEPVPIEPPTSVLQSDVVYNCSIQIQTQLSTYVQFINALVQNATTKLNQQRRIGN